MNEKIKDIVDLKWELEKARCAGRRIVFTNGCFDLLHVGHIRYLQAARKLGDLLVVGLNSDRSVRALKGEGRPLVPEAERAEILASLSCVDYVVLFDEVTPLGLILEVEPDILVKGMDWAEDQVVGRREVEARGGKVVRMPLVEGVSTTTLIRRIVERFSRADSREQRT